MSESIAIPATYVPATAPRPLRSNSTYRDDEVLADWFNVLKWCLIPIVCFTVYWFIEKYIIHAHARLVPNPAEFPGRVFGLAHYVVGLLFLMSSKRMKKAEGWIWFSVLLALSLLIAVFFYNFGGNKNTVLVIFYFLFFMVHGFRDMVFFYRPATCDASLERAESWVFGLTQACLILVLMYVLAPAYLLFLHLKPRRYEPEIQTRIDVLMPYLKGILMLSWMLLLVCLAALWRVAHSFPGGVAGIWSRSRPVFIVLLSAALIIVASPLVGPWVYNLLILSHYVGWYFYASRRLATLPRQARPEDGLWKWFRGSVAGFHRLHIGLAAIFLAAIFINHFVLADRGLLQMVVGSNAFYYWTIIHVTTSFAPRS